MPGVHAYRTHYEALRVRRARCEEIWKPSADSPMPDSDVRSANRRQHLLLAVGTAVPAGAPHKIRTCPQASGSSTKVDDWLSLARHMRDLLRPVPGSRRLAPGELSASVAVAPGKLRAVITAGSAGGAKRVPKASRHSIMSSPATQGQQLHRDPAAIPLDGSRRSRMPCSACWRDAGLLHHCAATACRASRPSTH